MRVALEFPVEQEVVTGDLVTTTFTPMAVPPLVVAGSSVRGWIFHGDELVLVCDRERGWELPSGVRQPGETHREAFERLAWERAGILLARPRLVGTLRTLGRGDLSPNAPLLAADMIPCFVAEATDLMPLTDEFEAADRLLIEPALVHAYLKPWNRLMDETLAYVLAVRAPATVARPVRQFAS
jgi:8-oxo-dGTP pyrophosphatase MutT (NUDIX family)